jgi:glycosyltransferase involved in cell wall biosynthesis
MNKVLYLSASRSTHDQNFIQALSGEFSVTAITDIEFGNQLYPKEDHFDLLIYSPLNLSVPWEELKFDSAYGLCMAFEINELIEKELEVISKNVHFSKAVNIDNGYVLKKFRSLFGDKTFVTNFKYGCDIKIFYAQLESKKDRYNRIVCNRSWNEIHQNRLVFEALNLLDKNDIDFECSFIDQPPEELEFISNHADLVESGKVKFLERLNSLEMAALLRDSDIYISASRSDGTSVSLLEAMASGKIVVTTDYPANLELISPGENGFIFRNGDAFSLFRTIDQILKLDDNALSIIRERAQKTALQNGDWSVQSKMFLESSYRLMKTGEING